MAVLKKAMISLKQAVRFFLLVYSVNNLHLWPSLLQPLFLIY